MNRKLTFSTFGLALALTLVAGAFAQESSSKRVAASPAMVPVTITQAGRPIPIESLPPEAQAQVERVRQAAQGLADNPESGAQKVRITVKCTWEPLNCTITISW